MHNTNTFNLENISSLLDQKQKKHSYVIEALDFLEKTLPNFNNEQLYISFNGGKDATVVLFLTYLALHRANKRKQIEDRPVVPTCIYFIETNPFPEVDKFMEETKKLLNLNIIEVERNFKVSMKKLVENHSLKAVIMGSRRTDPYCDRLDKITASDVDKGYPAFFRINPIINWTYEQVWKFLLEFGIPFCKLYEIGYTYLGNQDNTEKNHHLRSGDNENVYQPAWTLEGKYEVVSRKEVSQVVNGVDSKLPNSNVGIFISDGNTQEIVELTAANGINPLLILPPEKLGNPEFIQEKLSSINFDQQAQNIMVFSDISESSDQIRLIMDQHKVINYTHQHFRPKCSDQNKQSLLAPQMKI